MSLVAVAAAGPPRSLAVPGFQMLNADEVKRTAAAMGALSGLEAQRAVIRGEIAQPNVTTLLGMRLLDVGEGTARLAQSLELCMVNPLGLVSGAVALALIDMAAGCAAYTMLPAGVGYGTVETKGNFVRPVSVAMGTLTCEARVVAKGRTLITAEAYVKHGDVVVAHGTSTIMVMDAAAVGGKAQ